jgi:hypothetical protein
LSAAEESKDKDSSSDSSDAELEDTAADEELTVADPTKPYLGELLSRREYPPPPNCRVTAVWHQFKHSFTSRMAYRDPYSKLYAGVKVR